MINRIEIDNFKCFDHTSLDLGSMTILAGANSTGKSSIIQAFLAVVQGLNNPPQVGVLNGRYIGLGEYSDVKNVYSRGDISISLFDSEAKVSVVTYDMDKLKIGEDYDRDIIKIYNSVVYLSADRVGAENEYRQNNEQTESIGSHGEFAFDFLSRHHSDEINNKKFLVDADVSSSLGGQVDYWLNYLTGYSISAHRVKGTSIVKVAYKKENDTREFMPGHVGTGVSYIATIIIAALSCKENGILIIENPELHLHPSAQSKFIEFFSFLVSEGLQVIIETHSDHIFNGVRKSLKKRQLNIKDVKIYYTMQNEKSTVPLAIGLNQDGSVDNYEEGFFDQFEIDLDALLGLEDYE